MAANKSRIHWLSPLAWAALALVVVSAVLLLFIWKSETEKSAIGPAGVSGDMVAVAQNVSLNATAAVRGDRAAYGALEDERRRLAELIDQAGESFSGSSAARKMSASGKVVYDNRDAVLSGHEAAEHATTVVPQLLQGVGNIVSGFGTARVENLARQLERFEMAGDRLTNDLRALADGVGDATRISQRVGDSLTFIGQVFDEFAGTDAGIGFPRVTGADGEAKLKLLVPVFRKFADEARTAIANADKIGAAHQAAREIVIAQKKLLPALATSGNTSDDAKTLSPLIPAALLLLGAMLLGVVLLVIREVADIRRELRKQSEQNERNQQAILRLLDELSNLADGDLTVQATVTEDITGAIADSINYAIEALRELVATINKTAITLDSGAKQTLASAGHLAKASVAQSKQVAAASESAVAMANSVEEVSGNAERSADVARHAVDISHKGGDAVRRTIDGMNTIRETIQETSKRIKRLGESSQEIGNIVELINDIAEQTNILALNASIQASMAGEAGRGFAVVADEVQRLAERAANATKQIEVLVRTIQADTNEAVVSMERSTTDVVGGALLAENAGAALEEIEQVSNQIASLVHNISASSRKQTGTAQDIARNMQVLREISSQTAENSAATSTSIGKLAQLSTALRQSVSGFRLPETAAPAGDSSGAPKVETKQDVTKSSLVGNTSARGMGRMTA